MDRRAFIVGAATSSIATLAGCLGGTETAEEDCPECRPDADTDSEAQFLEEGQRPESDGAEEFLTTVAEVTGGRTGFQGRDDTWRIRFGETSETWTIEYHGEVAGSKDRFREEIAALATAFATHRPDGVSLNATALHECTTGTWHVSAETAAAYERGDIDRETFIERVQATVKTENNC